MSSVNTNKKQFEASNKSLEREKTSYYADKVCNDFWECESRPPEYRDAGMCSFLYGSFGKWSYENLAKICKR